MDRRGFISVMVAAPFLGWVGTSLVAAMQRSSSGSRQNPTQSPMGNPDQNPAGIPTGRSEWPGNSPDFPATSKIDAHALLVENQKDIQKDVARLYNLAAVLHKEVAQTDSSEVLSLQLIHTAEEIEKLAKHIKNLARG